jgi:subfamily B ATP-binding cassette protein MsbA
MILSGDLISQSVSQIITHILEDRLPKAVLGGNENIDHRANRSALTQISGGKYSFVLQFGPSSTFLIATDPRLSQLGMHDLRRLLKYLGPHWPIFTVATFAMLLVGLLESAIGALIVPIFDQAFSQGSGHQTATLFGLQRLIPESGVAAWKTISVLLILFTLAKGIAEYFSTYLMARIGQSAVLKLRQDLYSHLLAQGAAFFERHRTNYLVSRLVSSAAAIETAVTSTIRDMLRESFTLIAFLAASFYYSWRLTLGSLAIAPIIAVLTAKFGSALRNLARESFEGSKQLTDTAQEALANQGIVKAYRAEPREAARFTTVAKTIVHANLRSASIAGASPPTIEMIGMIFVVLLLFFGQHEIMSGRMNAAQFLTFLFFLFRSYDPMRKLSRLQNAMEQALAAAHHVWEVMDEDATIEEKPNALELPALKDSIELRNVSFGYANETRSVLREVSLQIAAGTMVALVGESGGGKSTLTKLLPRFHDPTSGTVLWDGIDLREAKISSLRRQIALVTQETVLFNQTVRHNIAYGKPDATEAEIVEAAQIAFAHDFVQEMPKGYDTIVGERGLFLSGGQRQRLAIARAILVNAPVLILDEATSALDAESERLVQRAIANLVRNRTTIVIAHRLSTIRRADVIVVMEAGHIIEMGTHSELLARGGQYKKLYELQFADEEEEMTLVGNQ